MSISGGCKYKGIVMHKILDALGPWKEQSQPERAQFTRIRTDNLLSGKYKIHLDFVLFISVLLILLMLLFSM